MALIKMKTRTDGELEIPASLLPCDDNLHATQIKVRVRGRHCVLLPLGRNPVSIQITVTGGMGQSSFCGSWDGTEWLCAEREASGGDSDCQNAQAKPNGRRYVITALDSEQFTMQISATGGLDQSFFGCVWDGARWVCGRTNEEATV